jgi:hypothetical protein
VVAVVMGVDQGAHRLVGDRGDRVEIGPGAPLGGAGIHADHAPTADEEPGVVDPPAAIRLHISIDTVRDLLEPRVRDRDPRAAAQHWSCDQP